MDKNIWRIILTELDWKILIKLSEIEFFNKIVNHETIWRNIFIKQFPEHIDMIENESWKNIKIIFKDLYINGAYFYVPTLINSDGSPWVKKENVCKEFVFEKYNMLLLRVKQEGCYIRTYEKYINYMSYDNFVKKYPSIFYNNLGKEVTVISPHGTLGLDDEIFLCSQIQLFQNEIKI